MFYMILVLSRFSWIELRCSLAAVGLLNVGMAYVSGCGLGSIFFSYSPVHTSLFFIIMGLGVDDIFVVASCLKKISAADQNLSLPEKIGKTMAKAGTSITITSLTDIIGKKKFNIQIFNEIYVDVIIFHSISCRWNYRLAKFEIILCFRCFLYCNKLSLRHHILRCMPCDRRKEN
jgi:Patched family